MKRKKSGFKRRNSHHPQRICMTAFWIIFFFDQFLLLVDNTAICLQMRTSLQLLRKYKTKIKNWFSFFRSYCWCNSRTPPWSHDIGKSDFSLSLYRSNASRLDFQILKSDSVFGEVFYRSSFSERRNCRGSFNSLNRFDSGISTDLLFIFFDLNNR